MPYKGSGAAIPAVIGGQVQAMFANIAAAMPHIRSGKVIALGATGSKRPAVAPDLPTIAESGVKGYEVDSWFGMMVPKGVPRDIVAKINAATVKVLKLPETTERLNREGLDVVASSPRNSRPIWRAKRGNGRRPWRSRARKRSDRLEGADPH